jgi:beta-glucanase (GH16 family)
MRKILFYALVAGLSSGALAQSPPNLLAMTLTFDDEFSTCPINPSNWNTNFVNPGTINNELGAYTPDAVSCDTNYGIGRLRSDQRSWNGQNYTSGAMTTFGHFQQTYGYFIMRARIPTGAGMWPAFWMLPSSGAWPPELDIMENIGNPNTIYMTVHLPSGVQSQCQYTAAANLSTGYHTYALEWTPTALTWFVDGFAECSYTGANIPKVPMYMLASVAVGGTWPGSPNAKTAFPQSMDIDYIRAYQFNPVPAGAVPNAITITGIAAANQNQADKWAAKTGDVMTIWSQATVGPAAPPSGIYEFGVCGYSGSQCYAFDVQPANNLAAGSNISETFNFTVPSYLADGWYNTYMIMIAGTSNSTTQTGKRFTIQNNTSSPFITPLGPLPLAVPTN